MRITMPQLGESVVEGTVGRWLKREGETIERYEPLLEIITDKVNAEYPSPVSGTLTRILVGEGETVEIDVEIAEIAAVDEVGGRAPAIEPELGVGQMQPTDESLSATEKQDKAEIAAQVSRIEASEDTVEAEQAEPGRRYSPVVRRLAQEHDLDLTLLEGTGAGGRVSKQDVELYLERRPAAAAIVEAPVAEPTPHLAPSYAAGVTPQPVAVIDTTQAVEGDRAGEELVPLTPMRRAIAEHMVRSAYTSPHATTVIEVDMTAIARYREGVKARFEAREGVRLTYLPFFVQAVVESLKEHPYLNASWSEQGIVLKQRINIGIAIGMEDGLIVPVIHDADGKNLVGLARAVADLSARARSGQLAPADVRGGTFTVNNPGTFGTLFSTPIINQPQAAILSMEAITKRPVVIDDAIAIRSMIYASLSIDHRVLDGLQAARFLGDVKRRLEEFRPEGVGL